MKLKILSVGKVKEPWIREGVAEYLKRLQRYAHIELVIVKNNGREQEAADILSKINDEFVVALSEEGTQLSSVQFSGLLKKTNKDIVFIIGSADGLSTSVKKRADLTLSLSQMTFTHELAQLLLVEQLYRGVMILNNRTYHR